MHSHPEDFSSLDEGAEEKADEEEEEGV
jgi:hypothetical protein